MHDINFIRDNPELFDKLMNTRQVAPVSDKINKLDKIKRNLTTTIQRLQEERNKLSKSIGVNRKQKKDTVSLVENVNKLKKDIANKEKEIYKISLELDNILMNLPNLPSEDIPIGKDDSYNKEIFKISSENSNNVYIAHEEIGKRLKMMDFENASKISGSRFVILKKSLAKLERALYNFMIDLHVQEHGYQEVSTPHLVNKEALIGTGQLPKFGDELFKVNEEKWLIPTAEVTLTNIHSNSILSIEELPKRYVGLTNCFRSEAGAAGKDTRGMIRLHEFKKVELVSFVKAEESDSELERLTNCASKVIEYLKIPFRKVVLSTGDMGFSACKTYDLEVWMPSQKKYREISSCSNCKEFQSRRIKTKYKDENGNKKFIHTLNGSGLAVGRALVAIIENYQYGKNKVKVPEILVDYMRGQKEISI